MHSYTFAFLLGKAAPFIFILHVLESQFLSVLVVLYKLPTGAWLSLLGNPRPGTCLLILT